jgi:DNA polymerase III sliding clamp (beta) subunit (PCNA family)
MKFNTVAKEFQKALEVVEGIIPVRTPLPAATHVLIEFKGGLLTLTGTDASNQVQYSFPAEGEDGVALVPARKLLAFAKTSGRERMPNLSLEELRSVTENIELALPKPPAADFNVLKDRDDSKWPGHSLRCAEMTVFAAAVDDERHVLWLLSALSGRIGSSTDSRDWPWFSSVRFPRRPIRTPIALFYGDCQAAGFTAWLEERSDMHRGARQVSFRCDTADGRYRPIFTQVEGNYPNYGSSGRCSGKCISRDVLLQALKRASMAIDEKEGTVDLGFEGRRLIIEAQTPANFKTLEMDYSGEICATVFAPRYIAEALEVSTEAEVRFDLQGPHHRWCCRATIAFARAMPRRCIERNLSDAKEPRRTFVQSARSLRHGAADFAPEHAQGR